MALADSISLDRLVAHSDVVAELRRGKDTPAFFLGLGGAEQRAWSGEVLDRLGPPDPTMPRSRVRRGGQRCATDAPADRPCARARGLAHDQPGLGPGRHVGMARSRDPDGRGRALR